MNTQLKKLIKQIRGFLVSALVVSLALPSVVLADGFPPPSHLPELPPLTTLLRWEPMQDATMVVEFPNGMLFKFEIITWGETKDCATVVHTATGELRWVTHIGFFSQEYLTKSEPVAYKRPGEAQWYWMSQKTFKDRD